jgi:hypothetical protein
MGNTAIDHREMVPAHMPRLDLGAQTGNPELLYLRLS